MNTSIKLSSIQEFFDGCAPSWDQTTQRSTEIIDRILDHAGVAPGQDILDVGCGTGVLFPDYKRHRVHSLTAIDLSPEMVRRARQKWPDADVLCGDATCMDFSKTFDTIVIYNAFPHFLQPELLLENLTRHLNPGGTLTVAHGMSREALQAYHSSHAQAVSLELPPIENLKDTFEKYLTVVYTVSNEEMYQIVGRMD